MNFDYVTLWCAATNRRQHSILRPTNQWRTREHFQVFCNTLSSERNYTFPVAKCKKQHTGQNGPREEKKHTSLSDLSGASMIPDSRMQQALELEWLTLKIQLVQLQPHIGNTISATKDQSSTPWTTRSGSNFTSRLMRSKIYYFFQFQCYFLYKYLFLLSCIRINLFLHSSKTQLRWSRRFNVVSSVFDRSSYRLKQKWSTRESPMLWLLFVPLSVCGYVLSLLCDRN